MDRPVGHGPRLRGKGVYLYSFDIAYEFGREPLRELLGQPVAQFSVDVSHRGPRNLLFHQPQMVRLPAQERRGPAGPVWVDITVKILPIGAISISVRVPFEVDLLEQLIPYHDLRFNNGMLHHEVRHLAEPIRQELGPLILRPIDQLAHEEAYTVFCIEAPVTAGDGVPMNAEVWLEGHRRQVASLLAQEDPDSLSAQEELESTNRSLSYYADDLLVIDWDAALLVD